MSSCLAAVPAELSYVFQTNIKEWQSTLELEFELSSQERECGVERDTGHCGRMVNNNLKGRLLTCSPVTSQRVADAGSSIWGGVTLAVFGMLQILQICFMTRTRHWGASSMRKRTSPLRGTENLIRFALHGLSL